MAETNPLMTDLAGLSKPLCKLIDAVRDGIGTLYEPRGIRQKAKADAEAAVFLAEGRGKAMDLEARTRERILAREAKRQKNIEAILEKTEKELPETASEEPVAEDWTARFFDECKDVGNEELQRLWAKLLAGEIERPGSFSLRTLALVKVLRKEDADLFTRFCSCCWMIGGSMSSLVFENDGAFDPSDLSFEQLTHLQTLDLIRFESLTGFSLNFKTALTRAMLPAIYYGKHYLLTMPEGVKQLDTGKVMLTFIARELAPVAGSQPDEQYRTRMIEKWRQANIEVKELN
jgi:Protein of unknown function (DUF2806)